MKSHLHAHYKSQSYLTTQICLSFICLRLDWSRKSSLVFDVALMCSFSSSGSGEWGGCERRAETEQPSKKKLSQFREILALTLMGSTFLSPT